MHTIAIAWARFNEDITGKMRDHALLQAKKRNLHVKKVLSVPGAYEIPLAAKKLMLEKDVEGVVVLGAVKQGETAHDEMVAQNCARACMNLMLEFNKPIGFGVSGPRMTLAQAKERAQPFAERAVDAVAHMLEELKK